MRICSLILAIVLLLPVLASCKPDSGEKPTSLRPLETIVISDACYGEFTEFPEDLAILQYDVQVWDGAVRILARDKSDPEVSAFVHFTVSADGLAEEFPPIPLASPVTEKSENIKVDKTAFHRDGLAVLDHNYHNDFEAVKSYTEGYLLSAYDKDGNLRFSIDPEPLVTQRTNPYRDTMEYVFGAEALYYGDNGTLYMVTEFSVVAISPTGEKLYETGEGIYIQNSWRTSDGRVLVEYSVPAEGATRFAYMDDGTKGFSDPITLPDPGFEEYTLLFGEGWDYYYQAADGLYGMNETEVLPTLLCSWESSGVPVARIHQILILDENTYFCNLSPTRTAEREYGVLHRPTGEDADTRIVVTLGDCDPQRDFADSVTAFNRTNEKYYIRILDYYKQVQESGTTLSQDILAGTAPDIFLTSVYSEQVTNLGEKGAFVDLNTFLAADPSFRDSIFANVLAKSAVNGKLYQLPSGFTLSGMVGKAELLPEQEDWTLDTFLQLMQKCDDQGIALFKDLVRREYLESSLLYSNLPTFVDFENAACSFENDLFYTTIEYLKTIPVTGEHIVYPIEERYIGYRDGSVLLIQSLSIMEFRDYLEMCVRFDTEDIRFLGYPTPDGGKLSLTRSVLWSITADSPVQDGAWEFVRYALENHSDPRSFPVYEPLFTERAEKEIGKLYVFHMDNNTVGGASFIPENIPAGQTITPVTEKHVQGIRNMVENGPFSTDSIPTETIRAIISEELSAFYAGNITAEEAARRIQSRVSIYLAEQS